MARQARINQMAAIAAYLNTPAAQQPHSDPAGGVPNVQIAPGVNAPAPFTELTADQKRAFDANRQIAQDQAKAEQELQASHADQLRDLLEQEQEERDAFEQSASSTLATARRIGRGANVTLSRIPLPGGLTFPLIVLFVFFALLIPVNGHTRLTWLWLTLTNNASIGAPTPTQGDQAQQQGNGSSSGSIIPLPVMPTTPVLPLLSFTGVEEML